MSDKDFQGMTSGNTGWFEVKGDRYKYWLRGRRDAAPDYIRPNWENVDWINLELLLKDPDKELALILIADMLEEAGIGCDEIINQCRGQHPCWQCPESCGHVVRGDIWVKCSFCNGTGFRKINDSLVVKYLLKERKMHK